MSELFADEALAGAALEEELAGFGVFREEVGLVVDESEVRTISRRADRNYERPFGALGRVDIAS